MQATMAAGLQGALVAWFDVARRDMPWRDTRDPYAIWVSEIMLQQTQVATVRAYWLAFMARFPTVEALAGADLDAVLKAWEGLGYYSRARNLHAAARSIVRDHGGALPASAAALRKLPGFGPYTAGAVAAIAFGLPEPAVDGNVLRVLARLLACGDDVTRPATRRRFEETARALIPAGRESAFVQALMEFGSEICTPRRPACGACPVAAWCAARAAGTAESLPRKPVRRRAPHADIILAVCRSGDRVVVVRRPERGLLGGLMGFPEARMAAAEAPDVAVARALAAFGLDGSVERILVEYPFAFTHLRATYRAVLVRHLRGEPGDGARWVSSRELPDLAMPAALAPVRAALLEHDMGGRPLVPIGTERP